jgi:hypothetical protein
LGLCFGQPWLGQSAKRCTCVAGWNVCTARIKDVVRVAELGGDNVDDCLGGARLYFCALWNVETSPRSDYELQSARPKITAGRDDSIQFPSASGHSRRFDPPPATSGLPRSTDIARPVRLVRLVPQADITPIVRGKFRNHTSFSPRGRGWIRAGRGISSIR